MKIDSKDVLQFNATLIAGMLVFLTISSVTQPLPKVDGSPEWRREVYARYLFVSALAPFLLSSILIIFQAKDNFSLDVILNDKIHLIRSYQLWTALGCIYLIFAVLAVVQGFS